MKHQKVKTAAEARAWFNEQGLSVSEWCREHGFGVSLVREILTGHKPCTRGQSHQVAVLLGMKHGVITRSPAEALQRGPYSRGQSAAAGPQKAAVPTTQATDDAQ